MKTTTQKGKDVKGPAPAGGGADKPENENVSVTANTGPSSLVVRGSRTFEGCETLLDGQPVGPAEGNTLKLTTTPGKHILLVQKNGVKVYESTVQVKPIMQGTTEVTAELEIYHEVTMKCDVPVVANVRVFVDGKARSNWPEGKTEMRLGMEVGRHEITIVAANGMIAAHGNVFVEPGKKIEVNLQ